MCIGLPAGLEGLPRSDLLVDNAIFCTGLISGLQKAGRYKSCYSHFGNCLCLKRLETRTKECNMYARLYLEVQWKQRVARMLEGRSTRRSPATFNQPRIVGSTQSINVGTRKMVNYAWPGWSQGKPWWRSVAILTCKSIVGAGYRGERLIEPSSSWFLPKFPSG